MSIFTERRHKCIGVLLRPFASTSIKGCFRRSRNGRINVLCLLWGLLSADAFSTDCRLSVEVSFCCASLSRLGFVCSVDSKLLENKNTFRCFCRLKLSTSNVIDLSKLSASSSLLVSTILTIWFRSSHSFQYWRANFSPLYCILSITPL